MNKLTEAKDLQIFTRLVTAFREYVDAAPASGQSKWLDQLIDCGNKCVPTDKHAQAILNHVLDSESSAFVVQQFLNLTFDNLPSRLRPVYVDDQKRVKTALWGKGEDNKYDRVLQLMSWGGEKGQWVNDAGEKVTLEDVPEPVVEESVKAETANDVRTRRQQTLESMVRADRRIVREGMTEEQFVRMQIQAIIDDPNTTEERKKSLQQSLVKLDRIQDQMNQMSHRLRRMQTGGNNMPGYESRMREDRGPMRPPRDPRASPFRKMEPVGRDRTPRQVQIGRDILDCCREGTVEAWEKVKVLARELVRGEGK